MSRLTWVLAGLLAAAVFATNVYRAATQSMTVDEAFTYNAGVAPPLAGTLQYYDANNHVLNTLLARLSVAALGASEFSMRLPSLLGGLLYLASALLLARRAFGHGWLFLLASALLVTNPFLVDYLSAARGYGLALGFFVFALFHLLGYLREPGRARLYWAAFGLALAVVSNLTFAVPGAAAAAVVAVARHARWRDLIDHFAVPGLALAFVMLVIPLRVAEPGAFYYGASSLGNTVDGVVVASLHHFPTPEGVSPRLPYLQWLLRTVSFRFVPAVFFIAAAVLYWKRRDAALALFAGTLVSSVLIFWLLHAGAGVPYPDRRTAVALAPLFLLTTAALLRIAGPYVAAPFAVFLSVLVFWFVLQWNPGYYQEWKSDAGIRDIVGLVSPVPGRKTVVECTWQVEPTVNFYRRIRGLDWMAPVARSDTPGEGADYYILFPEQEKQAGEGYVVLHRDALSGVVLLKKRAGSKAGP